MLKAISEAVVILCVTYILTTVFLHTAALGAEFVEPNAVGPRACKHGGLTRDAVIGPMQRRGAVQIGTSVISDRFIHEFWFFDRANLFSVVVTRVDGWSCISYAGHLTDRDQGYPCLFGEARPNPERCRRRANFRSK